jgi:hypothetical protein
MYLPGSSADAPAQETRASFYGLGPVDGFSIGVTVEVAVGALERAVGLGHVGARQQGGVNRQMVSADALLSETIWKRRYEIVRAVRDAGADVAGREQSCGGAREIVKR